MSFEGMQQRSESQTEIRCDAPAFNGRVEYLTTIFLVYFLLSEQYITLPQ
jgi:hypothetical protein